MRLRAGLVALSFKAVLHLAAVLSLWSTSALAANIILAPWGDDPAHAIVLVEGRLESGDDVKFRTQVGRLTRAIVDFNSDGGDLRAGIAIGKSIRLKSFATTVLEGQRCASACALAWLGGSPRYMGRSALVGFHAAYIKKEGLPSESGVGNALVGSYSTQIGLSETAVVYITQAAPTEMTWLNLRNAKQIGIEVLPFEEQTPATKPAPPIPSRKASDYEECAENAVGEAKSQDALAILLSSCELKFTARRKRTGGYTFYDRRQNRYFDVAGPNPTPAELEYIERQYSVAELQKRQQIALRKIELSSTT